MSRTTKTVVYIPKPKTVKEFGCPGKVEFDKWVPEICGLCCFKMIGDTFNLTNKVSLWDLTQSSRKLGAFTEYQDGSVGGIYYKPLLRLAKQYGCKGKIYRWLPLVRIRYLLQQGLYPLVSINLHKFDEKYEAGHLVVITSYSPVTKEFLVHDPSSVLGRPGANIRMSSRQLKRLSNGRGLALAPKHRAV